MRGTEYAAGDRIVFLRNDPGREVADVDSRTSAGVRNGTLGTIEQTAEHRFVARLDDGRRVAFDPQQYQSVAHGYAVTLHKSQGATVDRVYVLADPMMNRNAAYVALTRHREVVHLYADRETLGGRVQLDRVLSRESRKDLARDYAAADLQRLADRVSRWQERAAVLQRKMTPLLDSTRALQQGEEARGGLERHRASVEKAAAAVFTDPRAAARALLADPHAPERLAAGQVSAYGSLRGRARAILGPDVERKGAEQAIPSLTWAVRDHHRAQPILSRQIELAAKIPQSMEELSRGIHSLSQALQQARAASRSPERALELAARQLGYRAVRAALELLPRSAYGPVLTAVRVVERALSVAINLGR